MKFLFLFFIFMVELFASVVSSPILSLDSKNSSVTIGIDKVDVGMSGFVVHSLSDERNIILKNVVVESFDSKTKKATLKLSDFNSFNQNALPSGNWKVEVGDKVILAFGYTRGLLVAPSENIYHRITTSMSNLQWIHPDIFATILSFNGHPTPLKSDFKEFALSTSVGLVFFYLDKELYTVDIKSFKILNITSVSLTKDKNILPFYMRVKEIDASWWGEGSDELKDYEPYYYSLLVKSNKNNKQLYNIIKNKDKKLHYLLEEFELKD